MKWDSRSFMHTCGLFTVGAKCNRWKNSYAATWDRTRADCVTGQHSIAMLWHYESVWPEVWPQINVDHCDLYFMVLWFGLISLMLFNIWTALFGIMNQYDQAFDIRVDVSHGDLYFMVQWFYVTSWRQFDVWASYFEIMVNMTQHLTTK